MAAELRVVAGHNYVVDAECGLEENWGADDVGARVRLDEHNEIEHPTVAAGTRVE